MKMRILLIIFLFPLLSIAQDTQCDSVEIACCTFNAQNTDTLQLTATNSSSYIFPYPGFILFNSSMDTVAVETVNYFGIGGGPQQHFLVIKTPIILFFERRVLLKYLAIIKDLNIK